MSKKRSFVCGIISISLVMLSVVSSAETIRFASAIYPPFVMVDGNQELHGFGIDIAKALCAQIKANCTFSREQFSSMAITLNSNKYDAWIDAVTICEEHRKGVDFTKPYFASKTLLIATRETVFNAAPVEIKGRTIGVAEHTCYIEYLKNAYGNTVKIKIFPIEEDSLAALKEGKVDAVIGDAVALKRWRVAQNGEKKYRLIGLPAKYSSLVWQDYVIAVAKGNSALIRKLDSAIDQVKSDGTYKKLIKQYLLD